MGEQDSPPIVASASKQCLRHITAHGGAAEPKRRNFLKMVPLQQDFHRKHSTADWRNQSVQAEQCFEKRDFARC